MLNEIGKEEGFQLQYTTKLWQGILEGLNTNQHDIVAAGVVVTPERQKLYDFSKQLYGYTMGIGIERQNSRRQTTF